MRYSLLMLLLVCFVLTPFVAQALDKPIIFYTFDNIQGDVVKDSSGSGNDGKMQNSPKVVTGKFGKGLQFADSRVAITSSATLGTELFKNGTFTVVLWMNSSRTGNEWQQVFRAGPDPNDTIFFNINGTVSWRGWVGAAWAGGLCESAANSVAKDAWVHIAIVSDAKNFRMFVDGKLAKESAFQATRGNNKEFMLGGYTGGESYSGSVDEFGIYKAALVEADVKNIIAGNTSAVESKGKLATNWATLKSMP